MKYGKLTKEEVNAIPTLIKLRILSNVVYFIGKAISKEDTFQMASSKMITYSKRLLLLNPIENNIRNMILQKLNYN